MKELSLITKLQTVFDLVTSRNLYLMILALIVIITIVLITTNGSNRKQSKRTYILLYLAGFIFIGVEYGKDILTLIDYAINEVFITYYFPNIVIYLLMLLLNRFLMNINKVPVLGFINRLGGIVFGAAIALLFLSGVCMIFSMLIPVSDSIGNFLTENLKLNSEDRTFAKIIYEYNLIGKLLEALF